MKKKVLFLFMLLAFPMSFKAQTKKSSFSEKKFQLANMSEHKRFYYKLLENRSYNSILQICQKDTTITGHFRSYVMAVTYAYMGQKEQSYEYALQLTDENLKSLEYSDPYEAVKDVLFGYPLAIDTHLTNVIEKRMSNYYLKLPYPKRKIGLELYRLEYLDQKARGMYAYNADLCQSDSCKKVAENALNLRDSIIQRRLLQMIEKNGGYFTKEQVGPAARCQVVVMLHISDTKLREQVLHPILIAAYEEKRINAEGLVMQLVRTETMKGTVKASDGSMFRFEDSLCKKYGCAERKNVKISYK